MAKKDYFEILKDLNEVKSNQALVDFIDHELDLLTRKNSGERKPTKTQKENKVFSQQILDTMEVNRDYSVTEIQKQILGEHDFSNQKVTALLRPLVNSGAVIRSTAKGKAVYTKAVAPAESAETEVVEE